MIKTNKYENIHPIIDLNHIFTNRCYACLYSKAKQNKDRHSCLPEAGAGRNLTCPNGAHISMYDDQENYFEGLIKFIKDVDDGKF